MGFQSMTSDHFLKNGVLITLNSRNEVLQEGNLLVRAGIIEAVGADLQPPVDFAGQVLDLKGQIVLPGTVNCHCHFEEMAVRSLNFGLPLEPWLPYKVTAIKFLNLSKEELTAVLTLACVDMLENGVTSGLHHMAAGLTLEDEKLDAAIEAYRATGLRAVLCPLLADKPLRETVPIDMATLPKDLRARLEGEKAPPTDLILERAEATLEKADAAGSARITGGVGPSAPQRCTDRLLQGAAQLAGSRDVPLHTHLLESRTQAHHGRKIYGKTIPEHLKELGYLSPRASFAHAIWVTEDDLALLAQNGCRIAHNPGSNLKLGSGIAPVRKYLDAGMPVGLGIDGANSSDKGSVFYQARLAALIHCIRDGDAEQGVSPLETVRMATWGGAAVMLMEDRLGSIEPGKQADLIVLNRTLNFEPWLDPVNALAFAEDGESVDRVFVEGEEVVRGGRAVKVDRAGLLETVETVARRLRENFPQAVAEAEALRPHLHAVSKKYSALPLEHA
jgi:cytosine/adenosine deaminase-related metal-dependent hydrolase